MDSTNRNFTVPELGDLVKNDQRVYFEFYRDGELWYSVRKDRDEKALFQFPVPISDIGNATFLKEDKSLLFMRYIRKHIGYIKRSFEEEVGSDE